MTEKYEEFRLSPQLEARWASWFADYPTHSHVGFSLGGLSTREHLEVAFRVCLNEASRIASDISIEPESILEIGCWAGQKTLALAKRFPNAQVVGLEPDASAWRMATETLAEQNAPNVRFVQGFGESLPFPDGSFDLIVSHTVIEHVQDVDQCIDEMSRVLRPGGVLHLEGPNYTWPEEPHLQIFTPPRCSKSVMKFFAALQGKKKQAEFIDGLQLVYPRWIEDGFRRNGLLWHDRAVEKVRSVLAGGGQQVVAYRRAARFLQFTRRIGLSSVAAMLLVALKLYPSLLYTVRKKGNR